jgi:TnpA family transposase
MLIQLSDRERRFLLELLEREHKETLHQLHHTDTADFKRLLAERVALLEQLVARLAEPAATS